MKKVKITQDPENEIATDVLAAEIIEISNAMFKIRTGKLKENAIALLVHHSMPLSTRVSPRIVTQVMCAIENLRHEYVRERK